MRSFRLLALLVLSACGSQTGAIVPIELESDATPRPTQLQVKVFSPAGLIGKETVAHPPSLPAELRLQQLPDVDQTVRVVVSAATNGAPLLGGVAFDAQRGQVIRASSLVLSAMPHDADGDGVPDALDNCEGTANPDQTPVTDCPSANRGPNGDSDSDGGPNGDSDAAPSPPDLLGLPTTMSINAVRPEAARAGDTITIEGTFAANVLVQFPGAAAASSPVRAGSARVVVKVPADATVGELTVYSPTANSKSNAIYFRRFTFDPQPGPFLSTFDQAGVARNNPETHYDRGPAVLVRSSTSPVRTRLCLINDNFLHQQDIPCGIVNADGTVGSLVESPATNLVVARPEAAVAATSTHIYVVGGGDSSGYLNSAEIIPINPDGTLGTSSLAIAKGAPVHLDSYRGAATAVVLGNYLYVTGGEGGSAPPTPVASAVKFDTVERAPIDPSDGSLGPFEKLPGVKLSQPRARHELVVVGSSLYAFGGFDPDSPTDKAPINDDGSIGTFVDDPATKWVSSRLASKPMVLGDYLYFFGGGAYGDNHPEVWRSQISGGALVSPPTIVAGVAMARANAGGGAFVAGNDLLLFGNTHEVARAALSTQGKLGNFTATPGKLALALAGAATFLVGNQLYVVGGKTQSGVTAVVQRATVADDGTLGPFVDTQLPLKAARSGHTAAIIGKYVFIVGGADASGTPLPGTASIERAIIMPDGTLTAFAGTPENLALSTPRSQHLTVFGGLVFHDHNWYPQSLYVIGGATAGDMPIGTTERLSFTADGNIVPSTNFAKVTAVNLATPRRQAAGFLILNDYYVAGGLGAGDVALGSLEKLTLPDNDTPTGFVAAGALPAPRAGATAIVAGRVVELVGGNANADAASLNGLGALSSFASSPLALPGSRARFGVVGVTGRVYLVGGTAGGAPLDEISVAGYLP